MKLSNIVTIVICIMIPLMVGGISGFATVTGVDSWYSTINKPSFNPPNWIFGPVWTFLYILMGVSLYLIWKSPASDAKNIALYVFAIQLLLNFAWSFLFFYFQRPGLALIEIFLLWATILFMIITYYKIDRIAAYIQIPYLLWVSFASLLNGAVWVLNR